MLNRCTTADTMNASLWWARSPAPAERPPLVGDAEADVVIVGGGFTGLWTAYYLAGLNPNLAVIVLEAGRVGFGASGRNGGWCSALFPVSLRRLINEFGIPTARAAQDLIHDTVAEIGAVVSAEGIECDWALGGTLSVARSSAQQTRAEAHLTEFRELGYGSADYALLDAEQTERRVRMTDAQSALYTPHCAAVDPLALVRGLAAAAEQRGVVIHEDTRVVEFLAGAVRTTTGTVRAGTAVRATEAYTAMLSGSRRDVLPLYSLMIATEPLTPQMWDEIGLQQRETFMDFRHLIIYGQRTADDRFAFGGRGAPYHFASSIRGAYDTEPSVHTALERALVELFPAVDGAAVTHRWGGPLGATRDWWPYMNYDPVRRFAAAGGYVGDGVGTSNLAGRTLAHLIAGEPSPLLSMPWVNRPVRHWPVEPARWLGARSMLAAAKLADRTEARTGRASRFAEALDALLG